MKTRIIINNVFADICSITDMQRQHKNYYEIHGYRLETEYKWIYIEFDQDYKLNEGDKIYLSDINMCVIVKDKSFNIYENEFWLITNIEK